MRFIISIITKLLHGIVGLARTWSTTQDEELSGESRPRGSSCCIVNHRQSFPGTFMTRPLLSEDDLGEFSNAGVAPLFHSSCDGRFVSKLAVTVVADGHGTLVAVRLVRRRSRHVICVRLDNFGFHKFRLHKLPLDSAPRRGSTGRCWLGGQHAPWTICRHGSDGTRRQLLLHTSPSWSTDWRMRLLLVLNLAHDGGQVATGSELSSEDHQQIIVSAQNPNDLLRVDTTRHSEDKLVILLQFPPLCQSRLHSCQKRGR
mmetsp:Transcript_60126/g.159978  ORF Transcript_60126/g.159978 Transcript_60126/m.159978 type:complete len:258 (+) Transcript_60126:884-1657(+)